MVIGTLTETYYDSILESETSTSFEYHGDDYDIDRLDKELQKIKHISEIAEEKPLSWIDNTLLRLKAWSRKIENSPKPEDGRIAKIFYNIKTFLAKVIKKLTQLALRGAGTYKRWARKIGHNRLENMKKNGTYPNK